MSVGTSYILLLPWPWLQGTQVTGSPRQDSLGPANGLEVLVLTSGSFQILHIVRQPV